MVANELVVEPHVLLRHVTGKAGGAAAAGRVVAVRGESRRGGERRVAARANAVAGGLPQARQACGRIFGVRIVAGRAGELVAARSEQEVASFAGVRGA